MSTRDLVDALISGDSIEIENVFDATMAEKMSSSLDTYRVQLAQSMFNPAVAVEDLE